MHNKCRNTNMCLLFWRHRRMYNCLHSLNMAAEQYINHNVFKWKVWSRERYATGEYYHEGENERIEIGSLSKGTYYVNQNRLQIKHSTRVWSCRNPWNNVPNQIDNIFSTNQLWSNLLSITTKPGLIWPCTSMWTQYKYKINVKE